MKQYFKHKITGKIERYPERYGRLFKDVLEPVDDPGTCLDCGPQEVTVEQSEPGAEVPDPYENYFLEEEEE